MNKTFNCLAGLAVFALISCNQVDEKNTESNQPDYQDIAYLQDYSVKYIFDENDIKLKKVFTDRNGVIQVLTSKGLFRPDNGHFQYPGTLKPDITYAPMADKKIADMIVYENQFVYADDQAVFSNAWAGKLYNRHGLTDTKIISGGENFTFLISDGKELTLIKDSKSILKKNLSGETVIDIQFRSKSNSFLVLANKSLYSLSSYSNEIKKIVGGAKFTCLELASTNNIFIGTNDGYFEFDGSGKQLGEIKDKLPWTELTEIKEINGQLWFGSTKGAFALREDGRFNITSVNDGYRVMK